MKEGDIMAKLKLNKQLIEDAVKLIEAGNYQKHVAQALGIDESTWYRWLQKGESETNENSIYREFYKSIKKAEAKAVARNVALIQRAAQEGNWQAAAWWLERKFPAEWGKRDKLDINAGESLKVEIIKVDGSLEGKEGSEDDS